MIYENLRSFVDDLRASREIVEITTCVDPNLEIAEIHRRVIAAGGPALLFSNVKGKSFPVVTNLFGTTRRVERAFGKQPLDLVKTVASLPDKLLPPSLGKLWGMRSLAKDVMKIGFRKTGQAPVLEKQIPNADLTKLPALTSWKEDGGPFLTLPLVHTPSTGSTPDNLGMYRIQIHEAKEAGMHFQIGKGGGYHFQEYENQGRDLPTNIYLGGPPAMMLAAIAPLPENVPELMLASLLQGSRLRRSSWRHPQPWPVAEAEFCLSGVTPAGVRRPEGPFGDHYGYYSLRHDYPVFRPRAIYHRRDAIFPATVVGKPRQEDVYLGDYLQELLFPLIPKVMPAVRDLWSYGETGYHSLAAAVLKERYGRESMTSVFRILGEGQLALTKFLLALDQPVNLRDFRSVLTHVLERADWKTDLFVFSDISMDTLDYTGPAVNKGSKGVIVGVGDPVRRLPGIWQGDAPRDLARKIRVFSPGCLVVEVPGYREQPDCVKDIARWEGFRDWPLIVAVDDADKAASSEAAFLWTTFTRFEPAADIHSAGVSIHRNKLVYEGPIAIDARMKPWYPDELFCDEETSATVTRRWKEYFPEGSVEMGESDYGHLFENV